MSDERRTQRWDALRKWGPVAAAGAALCSMAAFSAIARRRVRPQPGASDDAAHPSWTKLLAEGPAAARLIASQVMPAPVREAQLGEGRPVMVIPGLVTNDAPTFRLRRTLKACGFRPYGWSQGLNVGARVDLFERLDARLDEIIEEAGRPVALIGWSLGGLYARELAKRRPHDVSLVVTLGSPFSGDLHDNNAWKLYEAINDHPVDDPPVSMESDRKPPVHTVAVWSARDGIVAPASASGKPWESDEQLEVHCKHHELVSHPEVLRLLVNLIGGTGEGGRDRGRSDVSPALTHFQ